MKVAEHVKTIMEVLNGLMISIRLEFCQVKAVFKSSLLTEEVNIAWWKLIIPKSNSVKNSEKLFPKLIKLSVVTTIFFFNDLF